MELVDTGQVVLVRHTIDPVDEVVTSKLRLQICRPVIGMATSFAPASQLLQCGNSGRWLGHVAGVSQIAPYAVRLLPRALPVLDGKKAALRATSGDRGDPRRWS